MGGPARRFQTDALAAAFRKPCIVLGCLVLAFITYATLCPIQGRPSTGRPDLERFAAFFLLGALFSIGAPDRRNAIGVAVVTAAFGLEAAQLLIPTRDAHLHDAFVKALGGVAGVVSPTLVIRQIRYFDGHSGDNDIL